jgi:phosphoribosylaminoimidazolecarboxamide formyltransferase/IMP cyclohydrolase
MVKTLIKKCVGNAQKLHGKELSFNNIIDLDSALDIVMDFEEPTSSVIKHTNPCGVASADTISEAYLIAEAADSLSAFGSVVGLNRNCDLATAEEIKKHFVEAVIAPDFEPDAIELLSKKKSIRLLKTGAPIVRESPVDHKMMKVKGGILIQTGEFPELKLEDLKVVTEKKPTEIELQTMVFAWKVLKHVKSNSILLAQGKQTVGIGAGQMSRVDSSMIAARKAGDAAKGSVMASDAFFPFRDGIDAAAKVGVSAIIQPGGSVRDEEVIAAANEHGMSMVFSGIRLFKH